MDPSGEANRHMLISWLITVSLAVKAAGLSVKLRYKFGDGTRRLEAQRTRHHRLAAPVNAGAAIVLSLSICPTSVPPGAPGPQSWAYIYRGLSARRLCCNRARDALSSRICRIHFC